MNRNHQNQNTQNHTARGRNHIARRQLGPSFHTPMRSNPSEERNVRYSMAAFWSEKDYPFIDQGKIDYQHQDFYAPEKSQSSNYIESDIRPVPIMAKESLRHENDAIRYHDHHGRHFSYRAEAEIAETGNEEYIKSYAGVGPKDYTRSDAFIEEEVCEMLAADIFIDASDITVSVKDGNVRLFGTVPSRHHKFDIEDLVEAIPGVNEVQNDIRVKKH